MFCVRFFLRLTLAFDVYIRDFVGFYAVRKNVLNAGVPAGIGTKAFECESCALPLNYPPAPPSMP